MPLPNQPPAGPMQGLDAARPAPPQAQPPDPKAAAIQLLKTAVQQFGPEIIQALKEILDNIPGAAGPAGEVPGPGMSGPGMMNG